MRRNRGFLHMGLPVGLVVCLLKYLKILPDLKEFLAIRRGISLIGRSFYFVEIMAGDTRHTQQIHLDESSIYPYPLVRIFKTGFPKCM